MPTDPISSAAQEIHAEQQSVPIEDVLRQAWEKAEDYHRRVSIKIHRFPASLREYCEDRQYIAPKMVAMGPYHRHLPEVLEMEEVKKAAAHHFCHVAEAPPEAAYKKVLAVAGDARSCYDAGSIEGISDAAFASMMFHDACFLLLYILAITEPRRCPPSLVCRTGANKHVVATDMFLLENQITWVVVEALMTLRGQVDLSMFIATMGMNIQSRLDRRARALDLTAYKPPHLLGLFHFYQSGHAITSEPVTVSIPDFDLYSPRPLESERTHISTDIEDELEDLDLEDFASLPDSSIYEEEEVVAPEEEMAMAMAAEEEVELPSPEVSDGWGEDYDDDDNYSHVYVETYDPGNGSPRVLESLPLGTSAIELAQIGIKLTPSKTAEFKDIGLTEGLVVRKLFLPSLHLNENTACWLVNMAAFETCTALKYSDYTVSSYLSLFAMFMDREEDVHELRAKRLIHGEFTDKQALDFFKGRHASNMRPGYKFYAILRRLEGYKKNCRLWIAIHRFVYKNLKTIVTVLSIISVLVAIFKTLLALKKH